MSDRDIIIWWVKTTVYAFMSIIGLYLGVWRANMGDPKMLINFAVASMFIVLFTSSLKDKRE